MKTPAYSATCRLSEIDSLQEDEQITYSAVYETNECSRIEVSKSNARSTTVERFTCRIDYCTCIGIIQFLKENCVYPVHCQDILSDLGYQTLSA